jgi:soluble lytic murein transglycosylase-like protein
MSIFDKINSINAKINRIERTFGGDSDQQVNQSSEDANVSFSSVYNEITDQGSGIRNLTPVTGNYSDIINRAAEKYKLDPSLLQAVIKQESGFNQNAISHCGAQGLMQLMPETAKELGVTDPFDPEQNIMGGARYLRSMLDRFDNSIPNALAAYNAGAGNVQKYKGIPPFAETQNYVASILAMYEKFGKEGR